MVEYGEQNLLAYAVHPCGHVTALGSAMPKEFHHSTCLKCFHTNLGADLIASAL